MKKISKVSSTTATASIDNNNVRNVKSFKKLVLIQNWFFEKKCFENQITHFDVFYCKNKKMLNKFNNPIIFAILEKEKETEKAFLIKVFDYKYQKDFKIWVPKCFCQEILSENYLNENGFKLCNIFGN